MLKLVTVPELSLTERVKKEPRTVSRTRYNLRLHLYIVLILLCQSLQLYPLYGGKGGGSHFAKLG